MSLIPETMINAAFSPASLKQLEEIMIQYFDQFITGIENQAQSNDGLIDLNQWFHNLAFDVSDASTSPNNA
jgi:cytochrome P450